MESIEQALHFLDAFVLLGTLAIAVTAMLRSVRRTAGTQELFARLALRAPVLIVATVAFMALLIALWHDLPLRVPAWLRATLPVMGSLLVLAGCGLYLRGLRTLGAMFGPSSGFGVRLHVGHRLVDSGPYACVRHPMYLAVMLAAWGSLLVYRTWGTLVLALMMFGLILRARREERLLSAEFGEAWGRYAERVPAWVPRWARRPSGRALDRSNPPAGGAATDPGHPPEHR